MYELISLSSNTEADCSRQLQMYYWNFEAHLISQLVNSCVISERVRELWILITCQSYSAVFCVGLFPNIFLGANLFIVSKLY